MKKQKLNYLGALILSAAFVTSCKDDVVKTTIVLENKTASNIAADPATNGNRFAFYSLERNENVANSDSATTKWDIGFRGTTIITNAGSSGPGVGGAFVQTAVNFDNYNTISNDSTFKTDAAPVYAIPAGSGNGWYNYNFAANLITPIPGRILVIRTATGKYAKMEILSYYKDAPATPLGTDPSRYYTFRFIYQANGTKSF